MPTEKQWKTYLYPAEYKNNAIDLSFYNTIYTERMRLCDNLPKLN